MNCKRFFLMAALALFLGGTTMAQTAGLVPHRLQIVDEFNRKVTDITTITVRSPGTANSQTIWQDRYGNTVITQPQTSISANTTLSNGAIAWFGPDAYDLTATSTTLGTIVVKSLDATISHAELPTYLPQLSSLATSDAQSVTLGTDLDWVIQGGNTAGRLTFTPAADDNAMWLGNATVQADVKWWAGSGTTWVLFDQSANEVDFVGLSAVWDDNSSAVFGTDKDWIIYSSTAKELDLVPAVTDETPIVKIGGNTCGADFQLFAAGTGDYMLWDASDSSLKFVDTDLKLDDDAMLYLGTDLDFSIKSTTTKTLDILPLTTDETSVVNFGADTAGVDLKIFGATTGLSFLWDASLDKLVATDLLNLFTTTGAVANQFKVDATGTVAGNAIVLQTTNGGVGITAGNATNGDITIQSADDMALTTTGDGNLTETVAGNWSVVGSGTAAITATTSVSLNASNSTSTTNVGTGSTSGLVTLGGASNDVAINVAHGLIMGSGTYQTSPYVYCASVTLNAAQIAAAYTTPIAVVGVPGTHQMIVPVSVAYFHKYATSAFTHASDTNVQLQYDSTGNAGGTVCSGTVSANTLLCTTSANTVGTAMGTGIVGAATLAENKGVYVTIAAGNVTIGTAAGTLTVMIFYRVTPTGF